MTDALARLLTLLVLVAYITLAVLLLSTAWWLLGALMLTILIGAGCWALNQEARDAREAGQR